MSPFNSRRLIALALSFGEETRRAAFPVFDLIERFCPQLSGVPFDFELHADLSHIGDQAHYAEATGERIRKTRERLAHFEQAAG